MATIVQEFNTGHNTPGYVAEGSQIEVWRNRLGAGITAELVDALVAAGYGYSFNGGVQSTPITGAGVYVSTTPDMDIQVPADKVLIPFYVCVKYEAVGTNGIQEVIMTAGIAGTFATGGTAITPKNMDVSLGNASGVLCQSPASSAVLMTTNLVDIWTSGVPVGITKTTANATSAVLDNSTRFEWYARNEGAYPRLRGTSAGLARLNIWGGGQAPTLFIIVKALVLPAIWFS